MRFVRKGTAICTSEKRQMDHKIKRGKKSRSRSGARPRRLRWPSTADAGGPANDHRAVGIDKVRAVLPYQPNLTSFRRSISFSSLLCFSLFWVPFFLSPSLGFYDGRLMRASREWKIACDFLSFSFFLSLADGEKNEQPSQPVQN